MTQEAAGTGPARGGVGPRDLRVVNERVVLAAITDDTPRRVTDLMHSTRLTRGTVMGVLRDLVDKDWLIAEAATSGSRGRPATVFRPRRVRGLTAGLDVGAHEVRAALTDLTGEVVARAERPVEPALPRHERLAIAERALDACLASAQAGRADLWSGLAATTGTVDDGVVTRSAAIADWAGVRLAAELRARTGVPWEAGNDIQLLGLAEHRWGAAAGVDHLLLVWLARRPSLTLVVQGEPYTGAHNAAGDLSRSGLLPDDLAFSGSGAWLRLPAGSTEGSDPFAVLVHQAQTGDAEAVAAFRHWVERLAPVVALFAAVVDPNAVVVGGLPGTVSGPVMPVLTEALQRHLTTPPDLVASTGGRHAVADGAARFAAERARDRLLDNDGRGAAPFTREALLALG